MQASPCRTVDAKINPVCGFDMIYDLFKQTINILKLFIITIINIIIIIIICFQVTQTFYDKLKYEMCSQAIPEIL